MNEQIDAKNICFFFSFLRKPSFLLSQKTAHTPSYLGIIDFDKRIFRQKVLFAILGTKIANKTMQKEGNKEINSARRK